MRAPVQKKRPRGNSVTATGTATRAVTPTGTGTAGEATTAATTAEAEAVKPPEGRRVRVRNRLVAGVAFVGITVVVAGTPAVLSASADLKDAQNLVTLAELNQQAVTLGHSLADERDEVIVYIAAGRDAQPGGTDEEKAKYTISETRSARVDRQIDEIHAAASASPGLLRDLSTVPSIRRAALTGKGSAMEAYRAYSEVIAKLQALADELAENTPPEAADGTRAPAALGRAVEQASATRGLLLAALAVPRPTTTAPQYDPITGLPVESSGDANNKKNDQVREDLSADAQKSRVRELGALADFDQSADTAARESLTSTVTGPDVKTAESYLTRLTDRPELSEADREADQDKVESALSARIDQMRGVESGLVAGQIERLEQLRDDDVTGLELQLALLGGCLIIAVGVSTAVARTLTRPLAVVRLGAARLSSAPATEEPIRFTGRNDEFAQVVRSVNALHGKLLDLSGRADRLDSDRSDLLGAREKVAEQRAELQDRTAELAAQLQQLRHTVHHTFVNLSLRTLGLVERQLGVIEGLEDSEQDPERLATLFKLDHMATVMRRHSENLLVLAGHDHVHGPTGPVPLVDVLRAAVSEIERYERVIIQELPSHTQVAGFAADDLSHLVAELLENAASFAPPETEVRLSGWMLESGEVMVSVQDQGIGMSVDRLAELNARLADPENPGQPPRAARGGGAEGEGLGLRVAALLAARHGVQVELREHQEGGVAAIVVLPASLLPAVEPAAVPDVTVQPVAEPAAVPAEAAWAGADAPALPTRTGRDKDGERDPLVVAAEAAIRRAEAAKRAEAERAAAQAPVAEPADAAAPYGIGPDRHERVPDGAPRTTGADQDTFQMRLPQQPAQPARTAGEPRTAAGTTDTVGTTDTPGTPGIPGAPGTSGTPGTLGTSGAAAGGDADPLTDKGLPKRTPRVLKPTAPAAPAGRTGSVDAEALRRRLGGFQQGVIEGRRDVEAELGAEAEPGAAAQPGAGTEPGAEAERDAGAEPTEQTPPSERTPELDTGETTGETVKEARS
ncbi:nitrate- and nitrite sensing domain-containing protein [Streptomyces sp. NPDC059092]|uniref:sensor histidine kinase n=1 Tax=Streptomyces sp. NPDC059092 TaxID=3346725 RepID=UPI0036A81A42